MINKPTRLGSILVAVLLVLMPAQPLLASVAVLNVQPGPGGKPTARSFIKETVTGDRFETHEKEIQQVLLSDGTSLTLGPGSAMVIESFTYDPQTQSGQLNIRLERGQFRIVGGLLNNTGNIAVQTPSGKLDLDNASVFVEIQANGATRASLLHGKSFKMTTNGKSETVERPAFEVVSTDANQPLKSPSHQDPKMVAADALALNSQSLLDAEGGGGVGDPGGQGSLVLASLSATGNETPFTSGLTINNASGSGGTDGGGGGFTRPGLITGGNPSGGFGPGQPINAANISDNQPSQADGDRRLLAQVNTVDQNGQLTEADREKGRTTNRLFPAVTVSSNPEPFTQVLGEQTPVQVADKFDVFDTTKLNDKNLEYVFYRENNSLKTKFGSSQGLTTREGLSLAIDRVDSLKGPNNTGTSFFVSSPFLLLGIDLPKPNEVFKMDIESRPSQEGIGSIFIEANPSSAQPRPVPTHFEILQAGFSHVVTESSESVQRKKDNFLLIEARPGQVDKRVRDSLKENFLINGSGINDPIAFVHDIGIPVGSDPNRVFSVRRQVDLLANVALTEIAKLGITAADVKGVNVNDPVGYTNYLSKIQPLLDGITALGADPANGISVDLASEIRFFAFEGGPAGLGTVNPSVDIDALKVLAISGGKVNDPIAFIKALGARFNVNFTLQDINSLATVILNPKLKPGTPLAAADLTAFSFLLSNDQLMIRGTVNPIVFVSLDPNRTERFLFATGDIDNRLKDTFKKEFSVDRFFISPGLEGFEEGITTNAGGDVVYTGKTVASSIRAFLRSETGLGLKLADTGLLVVNPGPNPNTNPDPEKPSTLLHADFGLQGERSAQQSTISVTIGNVVYQKKICDTCDTKESVEAVVDGRTIGSSHGTIAGVNGATVGFSSPIRSTAAGGGNPALNREGYAGYFVLENYDPTPQDPVEAPLLGGTEKPLGGSGSDQNYAYLRLATATGSSQATPRTESTLNGWMGGLAEFQNGSSIGLTQIDSGEMPDNVKIQTNPANNTVEAKFNLFGQDPNLSTTFNLGGLNVDGTSAFVDDNRFAARSPSIVNGPEVAMVTADLFRDAKTGNLPASLNLPDGSSIPKYEHLKWGFFFGDTKTTAGAREHVHLGTWIAGKIPTGDSMGLRGTAMYTGHSIGNVYNNGSLYTAVGNFENRWDFDKRTGRVDMNFDQTAYTGTTKIKGNTFNFDGTLSAPSAPARSGGLQGSFVAPVNPTPAAVMGGFAIAEGNTYRAAGTFGAERK